MKTGGSSRMADHRCRYQGTLLRWIDQGGPMPARLASHVSSCEACWAWATGIARVQNALALLATEQAPVGLLGRANDKALQMLVRQLREGPSADQLRTARPKSPLWVRLQGPLSREASAVAAAMIIFALRMGVTEGLQQVRHLAEPLAQTHVERHIMNPSLLS